MDYRGHLFGFYWRITLPYAGVGGRRLPHLLDPAAHFLVGSHVKARGPGALLCPDLRPSGVGLFRRQQAPVVHHARLGSRFWVSQPSVSLGERSVTPGTGA